MNDTYRFDGRTFAHTWLTVASAASEDDERPVLYRAVNVERDEGGVRLNATDSYRFWSRWVGEKSDTKETPYMDERTEDNATVSDSDFRARDLMKYVMKATRKEDSPPLTISLSFGRAALEIGQLAGFETDACTFTVSTTDSQQLSEALSLPVVEYDYPDLRNFYRDHALEATDEIAFNPELLFKMMKAVPGSDEQPCRLLFCGSTKATIIVPHGGDEGWPLRGALMPVRITQ